MMDGMSQICVISTVIVFIQNVISYAIMKIRSVGREHIQCSLFYIADGLSGLSVVLCLHYRSKYAQRESPIKLSKKQPGKFLG